MHVCAYVCVHTHMCVRSQGHKLHSHDIESVQTVEQVCYVYKCKEVTIHGLGYWNKARHDSVTKTNLIRLC